MLRYSLALVGAAFGLIALVVLMRSRSAYIACAEKLDHALPADVSTAYVSPTIGQTHAAH